MHEIGINQMEALLEGLAILGTGGGGAPSWGRAIMENDFSRGRQYKLVDPEDIEDDALVVSGGIMGSVKIIDKMNLSELLDYWEHSFELEKALCEMEQELGRKVDYIVPFEMGGLNTPVIMSLGARTQIPVINGDALGRAAPETHMTSFLGHGIPITPMPLVDHFGNVIVVRKADDPLYPDHIGRWVVTRGGGLGANNHYPMSGKQLKESVIPHTITKALNIGEGVLAARHKEKDPLIEVVRALQGIMLFTGRIVRLVEEEVEGFYFTIVHLEGTGSNQGSEGRLIVKNETMTLWKDQEIQAIFPDLVLLLEPKSGRGVMSTELKPGLELSLVGSACHCRLRRAMEHPLGQQAFSSKRYGQDIQFIPIERIHGIAKGD